jgi:hypothetical protein
MAALLEGGVLKGDGFWEDSDSAYDMRRLLRYFEPSSILCVVLMPGSQDSKRLEAERREGVGL